MEIAIDFPFRVHRRETRPMAEPKTKKNNQTAKLVEPSLAVRVAHPTEQKTHSSAQLLSDALFLFLDYKTQKGTK